MSMGKRVRKTGAEEDAFGSWRKVYCYLQRAGAVKSIKKQANKRARREGKQEAQREY